ncbi:DUF4249 domain-containing protein [Marinifilum caeruleilacunae]|uniref:DUF4249 domain-containing protein n=1 Tax=Marinifilum caeruleilacunae TaxID=2499076 RepID=A0ABX1WVZ6_9BACT|nr:DUF4249 domain-containing protein [Marinifilum caeruleilacunae]NOU60273.1 DUF4249 domain-containing protein [Marinifilum caeruleilacunae]
MNRNNTIIVLFILFSICFGLTKCVDPYHVNVTNGKNVLVVDALITNEDKSHFVKLSRSRANLEDENLMETGAFVSIKGDHGENEVLKETEPGVYKTDQSKFITRIGGKYILSIITSDGKHYESQECEILQPSEINNVYYKADTIINGNNEEVEGLRFYVDGTSANNDYLRWLCDENWKFNVPYATKIAFDENKQLYHIPEINKFCFKSFAPYEISIQALNEYTSREIVGKSACFIPTNYSDRFQIKYSISIKQMSISAEEYEFWSKMKKVNEDGGDMFGIQPFSIPGNIVCMDDDNEEVLGYFQTGGVASKRLFITRAEARDLGLRLLYDHGCVTDTVMVDEWHPSLYELYEKYVLTDGYGLYDQPVGEMGSPLNGLLIVKKKCTDCRLTGSSEKPLFWED